MKIAFVTTSAKNIYLFKRAWIKALVAEGHDIYAVAPNDPFSSKLIEENIKVIPYNLNRGSISPIKEFSAFIELLHIIMREKFDLVHTFSHKPNIYCTIAAKICRIGIIINQIEGLGFIYTENNMKSILLKNILYIFYRITSLWIDKMLLLNYDDQIIMNKMITKEKLMVINGCGVDVNYLSNDNLNISLANELKTQYAITDKTVVVIMIARLLYHKGIREYSVAANEISRRQQGVLFLIAGAVDKENPSSVSESFITETSKNKSIIFTGEHHHIKELLSISDIFVLPSYREGLPQTILEAMSMGKPVITTDTPGCSQTVDHMLTGIKIPQRDSISLVNALELLINNKHLRESMGAAGREKVVREFSSDIIIREILSIYRELLQNHV
ncbi:MAG: glycosyltransferase family 4 protein [Nitrospirota bacterium]